MNLYSLLQSPLLKRKGLVKFLLLKKSPISHKYGKFNLQVVFLLRLNIPRIRKYFSCWASFIFCFNKWQRAILEEKGFKFGCIFLIFFNIQNPSQWLSKFYN